MITHYKHAFIAGYRADQDPRTGIITFYKQTSGAQSQGRRLFSLVCRDWKDLKRQTGTDRVDWNLDTQPRKPTP
jgi:hypothetical protein